MIRARCSEVFPSGLVRIAIVHADRGSRQLLRLDSGAARHWEDLPEAMEEGEPTLILYDDEARALLDALVAHYQGAENTQTLRRDYDHERARVDKLTDAVTGIATNLTQGGFE